MDDKLDRMHTLATPIPSTLNRGGAPTFHAHTRIAHVHVDSTHTCTQGYTCMHTHTHLFVYVCLLKPAFLLAPQPLPFPLRFLSPQLGDMVEILVALSGVIGSGHRHLPQAEATGGFRPGSPSGNGGADGNSSLLSIRCEAENTAGQISSELMYKNCRLCAFFFFCKMEGDVSDGAKPWSDYILPSGARWSDEEDGWLEKCVFRCCYEKYVFI